MAGRGLGQLFARKSIEQMHAENQSGELKKSLGAVNLVLLGIGWNLLFVGATTLLAGTFSDNERFRAQGTNDFIVFGAQAVVSLLAGVAIEALGWRTLNLVTLPLLLWTLWAVMRRDLPPAR